MTEPDRFALALLGPREMSRADALAIAAGTPGLVLMERAGRAVADSVSRRVRPGQSVLVLCGPGNNGGDGFVAARILRERGCRVTLASSAMRSSLAGDAAAMAARWPDDILGLDEVSPDQHYLVVDALLGAGLNRALSGSVAACVAAVNASGRPVVAVDVPSGLSGETGTAAGQGVVATETVTFFRLKPGHLLFPGRSLCGLITLADIGMPEDAVFGPGGLAPKTFRNAPALWRRSWPTPGRAAHKFERGAVVVMAGGLAGVGAPRLGARAALRIGAGLVTIGCRPDALAAHAARGPDALMQRAVGSEAELGALLDAPRLGALLVGPALGLDETARSVVMRALAITAPVVLDADALSLLAAEQTSLGALLANGSGQRVLTPHEGEFARLFGSDQAIVGAASKLERARLAAESSGAIVVLKGADTVIASPEGQAVINATGSVALATAGSGDVLGGMIAGLLAQGMPAFDAACAAVWLHGRMGEALGQGLIADDLPEAIPGAMASMDDAED